jgi:alcohol dehydrogenase class IV
MQFQFRTAAQILFGRGEHKRAARLTAGYGRRVLLVTGSSSLLRSGILSSLRESLAEQTEHVEAVTVGGEPDVALADALARQCRQAGCDVVLAVGGGSVLDVGKAVAALAPNDGSSIEYLEDVGRGSTRALQQTPLPVLAVPTTAGSGSEVTRNSVLKVPELRVKRSLRSDQLLPKVAIVDPELVATAPQRVAAAAGMDALTHLIEGYLSKGAQPMTDLLALRGISLLWQSLHSLAGLYEGRAEAVAPEVHDHLALASMWGGIVLANAGLGAVHGLVAPLGGLCDVAHGDGCACLLPATFRVNAVALQKRAPHSPAMARLGELVRLLTAGGDDLEAAVERLTALRQALGIRGLAAQGVESSQFAQVISQSRGGSMRSNPVELSDEELLCILAQSSGA